MTAATPDAAIFVNPAILLAGDISYPMYDNFRGQLAVAPPEGVIVLELTTLGGDPEVARMIGEDIRFHSAVEPARRFVFLGKTAVYSAGVTLLGFFARENRFLTRGTRLMIHERQHSGALTLDGSLSSCRTRLQSKLAEIEESVVIQQEGFANLALGSSLGADEIALKAATNWYIEAQQALELGLIEAIV